MTLFKKKLNIAEVYEGERWNLFEFFLFWRGSEMLGWPQKKFHKGWLYNYFIRKN